MRFYGGSRIKAIFLLIPSAIAIVVGVNLLPYLISIVDPNYFWVVYFAFFLLVLALIGLIIKTWRGEE
jgi:uncharacterized membrane protein